MPKQVTLHTDSLEDPGDVDSLLGEKYITDIELKLHLINLNIYIYTLLFQMQFPNRSKNIDPYGLSFEVPSACFFWFFCSLEVLQTDDDAAATAAAATTSTCWCPPLYPILCFALQTPQYNKNQYNKNDPPHLGRQFPPSCSNAAKPKPAAPP